MSACGSDEVVGGRAWGTEKWREEDTLFRLWGSCGCAKVNLETRD